MMMLFKAEGKGLRAYAMAASLALGATLGFLPATPVQAQTRALPDFTDLVDQVGRGFELQQLGGHGNVFCTLYTEYVKQTRASLSKA